MISSGTDAPSSILSSVADEDVTEGTRHCDPLISCSGSLENSLCGVEDTPERIRTRDMLSSSLTNAVRRVKTYARRRLSNSISRRRVSNSVSLTHTQFSLLSLRGNFQRRIQGVDDDGRESEDVNMVSPFDILQAY